MEPKSSGSLSGVSDQKHHSHHILQAKFPKPRHSCHDLDWNKPCHHIQSRPVQPQGLRMLVVPWSWLCIPEFLRSKPSLKPWQIRMRASQKPPSRSQHLRPWHLWCTSVQTQEQPFPNNLLQISPQMWRGETMCSMYCKASSCSLYLPLRLCLSKKPRDQRNI